MTSICHAADLMTWGVLDGSPIPVRCAVVGSACFAALEVGAPAAMLGGVLGILVGLELT